MKVSGLGSQNLKHEKNILVAWHTQLLVGGGNSKIFLFSPRKLGKMNPFWQAYFSKGLVQPPTSPIFFGVFWTVGRWSLQCKSCLRIWPSMGVLLPRDFLACRVRNFRGVIFCCEKLSQRKHNEVSPEKSELLPPSRMQSLTTQLRMALHLLVQGSQSKNYIASLPKVNLRMGFVYCGRFFFVTSQGKPITIRLWGTFNF